MDQVVHTILRFDCFSLDLTRGSLRRGDDDIDLRPKSFDVLRHLAQNAGRLVSKQELYEAVWPNVACRTTRSCSASANCAKNSVTLADA
jgi:DNA-binding winged helix-turn-helix (wHTH) protein